jgi:hypothetical protein
MVDENFLCRGLVQGPERTARTRPLIGAADALQHGLDQSVLARGPVQVEEGEIARSGLLEQSAQAPGRIEELHGMAQASQGRLDLHGPAQGDRALARPAPGYQKHSH